MTTDAKGVDAIIAALEAERERRSAEAVLELAERLGIAGLVARHIGAPLAIAIDTARRLRDRLLRDHAHEAAAALRGAGVAHFFARGAALQSVYQLGDRDMADIDVYVGPEAAGEAQARLEALGYRVAPRADQSGPAAMRCTIALVRPARGTSGLEEAHLDLHWGIEPVDRLLPRADLPVPARVWRSLREPDGLWVPSPAHHAAIIVHHLVHHDFLHLRGLVDLVRLRETAWCDEGEEYVRLAAELGVRRVALVLHERLVRDCRLASVPGVEAPEGDWRTDRLRRMTALAAWIGLALDAPRHEHAAITGRRVARRMLSLDRWGSARRLMRDALFPPAAHLAWRWPDARSLPGAWIRHVGLLARGAVGR